VGPAGQREKRREGALGLRGEGNGLACGPRGEERRERGGPEGGSGPGEKKPVRERGRGEGCWAGLPAFTLFPFLLLSYTPLIQTKPIEFNLHFEFKPISSAQIKQCCGMNAQTL
jgi:hypothetical protein